MLKLEMEFKDIKQLQEFLNSLNNVPAVGAVTSSKDFGYSVLATSEVRAAQKEKNAEVTKAVEDIAIESTGAPDFAAVKNAVLKLSQAKGREAAIAVLAQFADKNGKPCEKVTAVLEANYVSLFEKAKEATV